MKAAFLVGVATLSLASARPAGAALSVGDIAPAFSTSGAEDGKITTLDLAALLRAGPLVIYFFPSAFTDSSETKEFAENIDEFRAAGATVLGMSRDSIDTLARFSTEVAEGKFALGTANEALVNAFDVNDGAMFNTRTTYVIAPSGRIVFVHDNDDPRGHVKNTLAFIQGMKR